MKYRKLLFQPFDQLYTGSDSYKLIKNRLPNAMQIKNMHI